MKKKFITITTLSLCLLVGCGHPATPNTNEDTSTEKNTEVKESSEDEVAEMLIDEPEVIIISPESRDCEVVIDGKSTIIPFRYAYINHFPKGINGLTTKYLNETMPEWSINETHYMDTDGNIINFEWEGFVDLDKQVSVNENTLILIDPERDVELRAWHGGPMFIYGNVPYFPADTTVWTDSTSAYCSLPENGYYNVEQIEDSVLVTYEVIENNSGKVGYVRIICNADIGEIYHFMYLETPENFDRDRAMTVLNSIKYGLFTPVI